MRSAVMGVAIEDLELLRAFVRASARLTHTDPRAEAGALAVALAARVSASQPTDHAREFRNLIHEAMTDEFPETMSLVHKAVDAVGMDTERFAASIGLGRGVTGFVDHTVPVAIHAWLSAPQDYLSAVQAVIRCGGDADTTAAIVGGIVGAGVGKSGIPEHLLQGLWDWPRGVSKIEYLASTVASHGSMTGQQKPLFVATVARNLFFLGAVLTHGFRRLLPPY